MAVITFLPVQAQVAVFGPPTPDRLLQESLGAHNALTTIESHAAPRHQSIQRPGMG